MLAALLLGGCTTPEAGRPPPPAEPASAAPVRKPVSDFDHEGIAVLLHMAEAALAEDRLMTPEGDSAYGWYSEVLEVAPDHPRARRGLERIVERYIELARRALDRQRWATARTMLDRAALVDRAHPGVEPLRQQVRLLSGAERLTLKLTHEEVASRDAVARRKLEQFGVNARLPRSRVSIRAGSDADGRWIYQQLNLAPGQRRIRGGIELGLPPVVTIVILPRSDTD